MNIALITMGVLVAGLLIAAAGCSLDISAESSANFRFTEMIQRDFTFTQLESLRLENSVGRIKIEGWSENRVTLTAIKKAKTQEYLAQATVEIKSTADTLEIRSIHPKGWAVHWNVDYTLKVPFGTALNLDQGVGDIEVKNYHGKISANQGVGEVIFIDTQAPEFDFDLGIGDLDLKNLQANSIHASVGTGDLTAHLSQDASFQVSASVGFGDLSISGFEKMTVRKEGFIAHSAHGTLGDGVGLLRLDVGVGDLSVEPI
ncbi:DUF4097 family beta strand repeat protein [Candidatus Acetothermia bacterium]|nr:DUF4097 family beta strand repeat protein [Candidatus Acetothermia bacterium]MBI3644139.1 DUF4097 family beta strand repeat protein [Candidatus Acetothermia bacterium]